MGRRDIPKGFQQLLKRTSGDPLAQKHSGLQGYIIAAVLKNIP
jgi:hypothetical protein